MTWRRFVFLHPFDRQRKPKTIQTFAGHAMLAITTDRYGHLI